MSSLVFCLVSFFASLIGSICGIGGGVIIKPVMDAFHVYSVSTVSFMSGCIVLSMTAYSFIMSKLTKDKAIERGSSTYLGIGAALGGIVGKYLFNALKAGSGSPELVGAVQSAALLLVTLGTAVYNHNRKRIKTKRTDSRALSAAIGFALGVMSSFLGIGGGPINLVVLYYFFSMGTKKAAQNSLYIILLSQTASLISSIVSRQVPDFPIMLLAGTVCFGILGGAVGRRINKMIDGETVSRLFFCLLILIMLICVYNFCSFIV